MTDEREARLPKWVRDELHKLRMNLSEALDREAERNEPLKDSPIQVNPWTEHGWGIPKQSSVTFQLDDRCQVEFRLSVRTWASKKPIIVAQATDDALIAIPSSSNVLYLAGKDYFKKPDPTPK